MKVVIFNGSPRKNGNTATALSEIEKGIKANLPEAETELINVCERKIECCTACGCCGANGGECVDNDDTNLLMDKLVKADVLIFGTPVYWWGVSAQLKALIDKFHSKESDPAFKSKKKVGVFTVGEAGLDNEEYAMIDSQFHSITEYLGWDYVFFATASAGDAGAIAAQTDKLSELAGLWEKLK